MVNEKDVTEKNLEAYNDVFSDIINGFLFNGQKVVSESELEAAIPRSSYESDGKIREIERDVSKLWKNNKIRISLFGIENQTRPDDAMPLRIIGYDGASYREQLLKNQTGRKEKQQETNNNCKRAEKKPFYPVVSIVLYFGYKHRWDKSKRLAECLEIPEELKSYVNDYKIHVFEVAYLEEEDLKRFTSDFRIVADYFIQARKNKDYRPDNQTIKHVREVLMLMAAVTGDNRFEKIYHERKNEMEANMSEALLDRMEERGEKRGEMRGQEVKLIKQVCVKMQRGQSVHEIAEDLVEDESKIQMIYDAAIQYDNASKDPVDEIFKVIMSSKTK